jgi:SAM-dependent methyltransferase
MPPWKAKAALQHVFSAVPGGSLLNYQMQRRITHGLPIPDEKLWSSVDIAVGHVQALRLRSTIPVEQGRFFEFGGGWDLHIAQTLFCLGAGRQLVIDLNSLLRDELVLEVRDRLRASPHPAFVRALPGAGTTGGLLEAIELTYEAPRDARATGLDDGSVDFVTSTSTLEHVPADDIPSILRECHRILSDRGAMSFYVDYRDHYAYFDGRISVYNFLSFDDRAWRRFNPPLQFQNRLRHVDYQSMYRDAGFRIVDDEVSPGTDADRAVVERISVADRFRGHTAANLAVQSARVTLVKA